MKRTLLVVLMLTLVAVPALADTKNGSTSQNTFQRWRFTAPGGDITVTINWTNKHVSTMFHLITCRTGPPMIGSTAPRLAFGRISCARSSSGRGAAGRQPTE